MSETTFRSESSGCGVQRPVEIGVAEMLPFAERITIQFLRAKWMRAVGATDEDIAEYIDLTRHPGSVDEELENLRDLEQLQLKNLTREELDAKSKRFANPPK